MDDIRKQRLLRDLKGRFRDAQVETSELTEAEWKELDDAGLENVLEAMGKLSSMSKAYRKTQEAIVMLHPHREAWTIISAYRKEIMDLDEEDQQELLSSILDIMTKNTRMSQPDIRRHIYAFWPVPQKVRHEHRLAE